jgi:hypothetical protein
LQHVGEEHAVLGERLADRQPVSATTAAHRGHPDRAGTGSVIDLQHVGDATQVDGGEVRQLAPTTAQVTRHSTRIRALLSFHP